MLNYIKPIIDLSVRSLCKQPYYNHPHGCPNYGKRRSCPPQCPLLYDYLDLSKKVMAIWVAFNLAQHIEKMRQKHPDWSLRQLECCLYWQGKVNKRLRENVNYHLRSYPLFDHEKNLIAAYCPEAMGVNVTETMKNAGVILEWPPQKTIIKVAFIGVRKESTARMPE